MSRRVARKRSKIASRPRYSRDDRSRARHAPDRVLGDHLDERPRVAAGEGGEDAVDALEGVYVSSGAIVRPLASSWEW